MMVTIKLVLLPEQIVDEPLKTDDVGGEQLTVTADEVALVSTPSDSVSVPSPLLKY